METLTADNLATFAAKVGQFLASGPVTCSQNDVSWGQARHYHIEVVDNNTMVQFTSTNGTINVPIGNQTQYLLEANVLVIEVQGSSRTRTIFNRR